MSRYASMTLEELEAESKWVKKWSRSLLLLWLAFSLLAIFGVTKDWPAWLILVISFVALVTFLAWATSGEELSAVDSQIMKKERNYYGTL